MSAQDVQRSYSWAALSCYYDSDFWANYSPPSESKDDEGTIDGSALSASALNALLG